MRWIGLAACGLLALRVFADSEPGHWSTGALIAPAVPESGGNPIDAFLEAARAGKGLKSAGEVDRRTLIRRLTFDLHGLPPTPEEIGQFVEDDSAGAYERLTERLLASPRYGERWARHWLDVVHFGETHGFDKDQRRDHAWRYRDYVIDSLNADKPYGEFIREQIAGDVLYPGEAEGIIATGFLAAGPWDLVGQVEVRENTVEKARVRHLDRDDIVTNVFNTFLSTTVQCAQCHDHKYDPIAQREYYSLQAVFAGMDRGDRAIGPDRSSEMRARIEAKMTELAGAIGAVDDEIAALIPAEHAQAQLEVLAWKLELDSTIKAAEGIAPAIPEPTARRIAELRGATAEGETRLAALREQHVPKELLKRQHELEEQRLAVERELTEMPGPDMAYAVHTVAPREVRVLERGEVARPGEPVTAGTLAMIAGMAPALNATDEGAARAALADWIADPHNGLTWRSIVNRVWQYHFGRGLVDTPNDFGKAGAAPSHPELLEWLAADFRDNGQSLKRLHRQIVMSAAYCGSSAYDAADAAIDGDNRCLWRMNRRKLESEAVRDAILQVSGTLDLTMGGPSVDLFDYTFDHSPRYEYVARDDASRNRRSIYRFVVRSVPDPLFEALDCADPNVSTPKRHETLTASQALSLLNDGFVFQQARHFAARLTEYSDDPELQIARAYELALGRPPDAEERRALRAYVDDHGLAQLARLIFNLNEFIFVD